jgi:hypothetical protein
MGRISSIPKMPTIEGLNGVGKTSIVNVASYKLYKAFLESPESRTLFVPCRKIFQLSPATDTNEFIDRVLMEVAQTLIERSEEVRLNGKWLQTSSINNWLNEPSISSISGGVWLFQAGIQKETNTSVGFERSGFRKLILSWLESIFPDGDNGGVVCKIDNLELLQSSDAARQILEQLRDELFSIRGIRWVLCGSLGIVYGIVSSPRLEGYLHKPIEIKEIPEADAPAILDSRISGYAKGDKYYIPINHEEFEMLFKILRGNLRSVLSSADDYCQWVSDRSDPQTDADKSAMFSEWLSEQSSAAYEAVRQDLRPKAIEVFEKACASEVFSPGDFEYFGFNSIPAFRPHIKDLESVGVLVSTQDEIDKRRKTIQVTPKGWLVRCHMDQRAS